MDQAIRSDERLIAVALAQPRSREDRPLSDVFEQIDADGAVASLRAQLDWAPEVDDDLETDVAVEPEGQVVVMQAWVDRMNRELRGG